MRSSCEERKPSLSESATFWCDSQSTKSSDTLPGAEYTTDEQISASSITLRTDECNSGRLSKNVDWIYCTAGDMMAAVRKFHNPRNAGTNTNFDKMITFLSDE